MSPEEKRMLEAARALYETYMLAGTGEDYASWHALHRDEQQRWLAVAKRAAYVTTMRGPS